ncbi:MAG: amidohydrolase family protein [Christensenellales bacterium]|jgi:dihydroorotase
MVDSKLSLLIRNGRVIDPYRNLDAVRNVGIRFGKIGVAAGDCTAESEIDAGGCLVVPGLIDYHGHINWGGSFIGIHPDLCTIPNGVTAVVDCGCTGVNNYRSLLDRLKTATVKSRIYINVSPLGQSSDQFKELLDPTTWKIEAFQEAFERDGDSILGLKVRISRDIVKDLGIITLIRGEEIAQNFSKKVMLHPTDPPVPVPKFISYLQEGDVYCHAYNNYGHTILGSSGKVLKEVWEAKRRGVLFDLAHGGMNFSWEISEKAFDEGFYPDLIGSDTTTKTWNCRPIYNLSNVMSKAWLLGMELPQVIKAVTATPARAMHMEGEWGTLAEGSTADITILKIKEGKFPLVDARGVIKTADKILIPVCTIVDGRILYRNPEFLGE